MPFAFVRESVVDGGGGGWNVRGVHGEDVGALGAIVEDERVEFALADGSVHRRVDRDLLSLLLLLLLLLGCRARGRFAR